MKLILFGWLLLTMIPASIDNSKSKYFPPVINQSGGSCAQASIIGYTFTYEMNRLLDRDASRAQNRYSYFYTWNLLNDGKDQGSIPEEGIGMVISDGVMNEQDFPPQSSWYEFRWESGYDKYYRAIHNKARWLMYIDVTNQDGIQEAKEYLAEGGIVGFGAYATGWNIKNYEGPSETGYDQILTQLGTSGPHALTIAGYDDTVTYSDNNGTVQTGAFIVVNTWGEYMHDNGRFYLPYHYFTTKHDSSVLDNEVMGIKVSYTEPSIVFRISVDYTSRDDLSFALGFNDNWNDTIPKYIYPAGIFNHQGGDHKMCGKLKGSFIDIGIDFTRHVRHLEGIENPNFFIDIEKFKKGNEEGTGQFKGFSVYDYRQNLEHPTIYTCTDGLGKELHKGHNYFSLMKYQFTSCSPVVWLFNRQPVAASLVFRTASGKYAKVRFYEYDRQNGTIRIKYVYSPSGDRNIK